MPTTVARSTRSTNCTATSHQGHSVVGQLLEQLLADTAEHLRQEERQMQQAGLPAHG